MKIVIAGAGDVGFHLAGLLTSENQDIILIDNNQDVLDYAATHLDVLTLGGDCAAIAILRGHRTIIPRGDTVLRRNDHIESKEYVHISQNIGVDTLINKKLIAANNIFRFVRKQSVSWNNCSAITLFYAGLRSDGRRA